MKCCADVAKIPARRGGQNTGPMRALHGIGTDPALALAVERGILDQSARRYEKEMPRICTISGRREVGVIQGCGLACGAAGRSERGTGGAGFLAVQRVHHLDGAGRESLDPRAATVSIISRPRTTSSSATAAMPPPSAPTWPKRAHMWSSATREPRSPWPTHNNDTFVFGADVNPARQATFPAFPERLDQRQALTE